MLRIVESQCMVITFYHALNNRKTMVTAVIHAVVVAAVVTAVVVGEDKTMGEAAITTKVAAGSMILTRSQMFALFES